MAKKKARRIRYVARRKGRKKGKKNPMGIPTIVWLLGGGVAAFLLIKKLKKTPGAPAPTAAQLAAQTAAAAAAALVNKGLKGDDDLYADVGGVLASGGLGSLG